MDAVAMEWKLTKNSGLPSERGLYVVASRSGYIIIKSAYAGDVLSVKSSIRGLNVQSVCSQNGLFHYFEDEWYMCRPDFIDSIVAWVKLPSGLPELLSEDKDEMDFLKMKAFDALALYETEKEKRMP